jgi:hypothetical protein
MNDDYLRFWNKSKSGKQGIGRQSQSLQRTSLSIPPPLKVRATLKATLPTLRNNPPHRQRHWQHSNKRGNIMRRRVILNLDPELSEALERMRENEKQTGPPPTFGELIRRVVRAGLAPYLLAREHRSPEKASDYTH